MKMESHWKIGQLGTLDLNIEQMGKELKRTCTLDGLWEVSYREWYIVFYALLPWVSDAIIQV